jgi:hypothetical protein
MKYQNLYYAMVAISKQMHLGALDLLIIYGGHFTTKALWSTRPYIIPFGHLTP